jgi:hypothetical protein
MWMSVTFTVSVSAVVRLRVAESAFQAMSLPLVPDAPVHRNQCVAFVSVIPVPHWTAAPMESTPPALMFALALVHCLRA